MEIIYINVKNNKNEWVWVKCYLHGDNNLDLAMIVRRFNQFYINNKPKEVFFSQPNTLFKEISPLIYRNYSLTTSFREISTKDKVCKIEAHFYSYKDLLKYLMNCIKNKIDV